MATNKGASINKLAQWGCLLALGLTIVGLLIGAGWLFTQEPTPPSGTLPTAILWTATPTPIPTPTPTSTPTPIPPTPIPDPASEGIGIGSRVRVSGTGEIGLNLRSAPGTGNERVEIAIEGESFIVAGGPQEANGLTWWLLRSESDPQREGWGAGNYLEELP
ncbi:MAG TPA: SH3 domain-containing protein [Chloroflexi bacterium]|nr:SH3 domain-containing protein [Chloroflexota bacterium]